MDERTICQNIKAVRLTRNMTLDDLSRLTGLSKGYLSKVERSGKLPPFSTLNRIATALEVEIVSLFSGQSEPPDTRIALVRKNERKVIVTRGSLYGYKYETLAHKPGKSMEPYIIEPASEEEAIFQHEGEELLYVLEGYPRIHLRWQEIHHARGWLRIFRFRSASYREKYRSKLLGVMFSRERSGHRVS